MSHENVEVLRALNRAFNAGDIDGFIGHFHPDAQFTDLANAPDMPPAVRGRAAIRELVLGWIEAFDEFRGEVSEFVDAGHAVICVTHYSGKGRDSGVEVDYQGADLHLLENGRVVSSTIGFPSKEDALSALGHPEV